MVAVKRYCNIQEFNRETVIRYIKYGDGKKGSNTGRFLEGHG